MPRALLAVALLGAPIIGISSSAIAQTTPVAPASSATDPVRLAAADHLLRQMGIEATLDRSFIQLAPVFAKAVIGELASNPQSKTTIETLNLRAAENHDRMIAVLSQEFMLAIKRQYPTYMKRAAAEYAGVFTTDELNEIAAFYSTGAGAKALKLMPELQTKLSAVGSEIGAVAGADAGKRAFERIQQEMLPENRSKNS
ncbi:MAG: DUF2059 domain-containing protein [Candidatus Sphingomonas colombiensis]|nr:DUF2059 domain-containing protein [Sphingomonas sp.]WEK44446.1 MAG: DUF2059 domain-containing protein [Sphingomonas sp.]